MNEKFPEGESPEEFYFRIKKAFEDLCKVILKGELGVNVMVITHGGVINIIYHIVKNLEWTNKSKALSPMASTGIHKLECINGKFEIIESNIIDHLK
ncbi:MAG: histidine phosphatase family protein [Clostridium sp.]